MKLDAVGNLQWQKSLGGSNSDRPNSIHATPDGGYIVVGYISSSDGDIIGSHGGFDCWLLKLDAVGTIQWQKALGGSNEDRASTVQLTSDGGYIVAGQSNSIDGDLTVNHGGFDYWLVKLDATGLIQWQKSLGGSGNEYGNSMQIASDGYIVTGVSSSTNGDITGSQGGIDYWAVKLDTSGNIQWQKSLGGSGEERGGKVAIGTDGGFVLTGGTISTDGEVTVNHGNYDYWIVKLEPEQLSTGNFEKSTMLVYPNPACDWLQIQLPPATIITTAKIIDVNGKVVLKPIVNDNGLNVENLAQGVYILETYSGKEKYTTKFVKE